jgi:hypothetical protein
VRAKHEVADVLRMHWPKVEEHPKINSWQLRSLGAIMRCRTAAMGGHVDACTDCGSVRISYNSCRNRHCPKCQGKKREEWIQKRESELLPVPYFHVVFTLPDLLNPLVLRDARFIYNTLFEAAWQTILTFGKDEKHLGATPGMIAILHTWGQQLKLHPHLHCIVPGGGLSKAGFWKKARSKGKYLFPAPALSPVFRGKFMERLKERFPDLDKQFINKLYKNDWVIYAKRAFGGPQSVLEYLGRYTHKIAISNHRILNIDENTVTFSYKDYRKGGQKFTLPLAAMEFIRRFSMHVLPKGFVRIRHFGILSSTSKKITIPKIHQQVDKKIKPKKEPRILKVYNRQLCTCCMKETMVTIEVIAKRGPPKLSKFKDLAKAVQVI